MRLFQGQTICSDSWKDVNGNSITNFVAIDIEGNSMPLNEFRSGDKNHAVESKHSKIRISQGQTICSDSWEDVNGNSITNFVATDTEGKIACL